MPTANPDPDFKDILPASPSALREFPRGDSWRWPSTSTTTRPSTPHRVEIQTTVTADDGNVVFSPTDERRSEELKGATGRSATSPRSRSRASRRAATSCGSKRSRCCRTAPRRCARSSSRCPVTCEHRDHRSRRRQPPRRGAAVSSSAIAQAFDAVWAAHAGPDAVAPPVDFDARMVAAVFAGRAADARASTSRSPAPAGGRRRSSSSSTSISPDPTRVGAQVMVSPFHIVSMPRDEGEMRVRLPDPTGCRRSSSSHRRTQAAGATGPRSKRSAAAAGVRRRQGHRAPRREAGQSDEPASSSTGLTPQIAAALAYLAGPLSGALLLATETHQPFVRFHAWQALLGLGVLGVARRPCLGAGVRCC